MIASSQLSYAGGAPLGVLFNSIETFDLQRDARTCNILWHSSLTYVIRHQPNSVTLAPRCRLTNPWTPSSTPIDFESVSDPPQSSISRVASGSLRDVILPRCCPIMANPPNKYVDVRPNSGHLTFHSAPFDYASFVTY